MNQANTSTQLIHPMGVVALIMLVLGLLIVLFPKESLYADPHYTEEPDMISVAYQRVLLAARPEDTALRIGLVTQLRKLGLPTKAQEALQPLDQFAALATLPLSQQAALQQERLWARMDARKNADPSADNDIREVLFETLATEWPLSTIDRVVQPFVGTLTLPDQVAFYQARLAKAGYTRDSLALQEELARLARFNGNPALEATVLETILSLLPPSDARVKPLRERWLQAALESSPELALSVVTQQIDSAPPDLALLDSGVQIALQNGALGRALEWAEQARQLDEGNPERPAALLDLALAQGEQRSALAYVEILSQLDPASADFHEKAARVYSWSHQEDRALEHWEALAYSNKDEQAIAATWQIALNLQRPQQAIEMLQFTRGWRKLSATEWLRLSEAYENVGDTQQADATLKFGREEYPIDHDLRAYAVNLALHRQDAGRLIRALQELEDVTILTDDQVLLLTSTYWNTGEIKKAHQVLTTHVMNGQPEYWLMRAELATLSGLDQDRSDSLSHLTSEQILGQGPQQTRRLIGLLLAAGKPLSALQLAETAYARYPTPEGLVLSLECAAAAGDSVMTADLLNRIDEAQVDVSQRPDIWAMRAQLAQQRGDSLTAGEAWAAAVALAPQQAEYRQAQLWFWLSTGEPYSRQLEAALEALAAQSTPSAIEVELLAFGWQRLGQSERALPWYEQGLKTHRSDWRWLKAYADALRDMNRGQQAESLEAQSLQLLAAELVEQSTHEPQALSGEDKARLEQALFEFLAMYHRQGHAVEAKQLLASLRQGDEASHGTGSETQTVSASWIQGARQWGGEKLRQRLVVMGVDWALAEQNDADLSLYEQWASTENLVLPAWQQLAVSMRHRDGYRIRDIVNTFKEELPLADQMLALDQVGDRSRALEIARTQPADPRDEQVANTLLEKHGNAAQGGAYYDEFGNLRKAGLGVKGRALVGDTPVTASVKGTHMTSVDTQALELNSKLESQVEMGVSAVFSWMDNVLTAEGDLRSVGDYLLPGLRAKLEVNSEANLLQTVELFVGQSSDLNSVISAVGQEQGVAYSAGWQAEGGETRASLEMVWRNTTDLDYRFMGQGYGVTAIGSQKLLSLGDVGLSTRMAHQHSRYEESDGLDAHLTDYFTRLASDVERFPNAFDRTSLALHLADERLHQLMPLWRTSPWHFLADTEVGYSWQSSEWDFGVKLGTGYRLSRHDELAFSLGWNESSESGEVRKTALLTYSRALENF